MKKYFGFIEVIDPDHREIATSYLNCIRPDPIGQHSVASDIVEEIVRRGGKFYKGAEARPLAPFEIKHDDMFVANFPYKEGETPWPNPAFAESNWTSLSIIQYSYGMYLTNLIDQGLLTSDTI